MTATLTISKARNRLLKLPKEMSRQRRAQAITVTHHGKPVLAILPWEFYDSLMETMEILGDPEFMASLRRGIQDLKEGKTIPLEKLREAWDL
jgi:prevent-host-death family protein